NLSVETRSGYAAFWINKLLAANLPTAILRHVLLGENNYRFTPSQEDARQQRIRIRSYHQITVDPITLTGPDYHIPGIEQSYPGESTGPVNFFWKRQWVISATSGFLVQEVETQMSAENCRNNQPVQVAGDPHYWEYWEITGRNQFVPNSI